MQSNCVQLSHFDAGTFTSEWTTSGCALRGNEREKNSSLKSITQDVNHLLIICATHSIQLIRVNFGDNVYKSLES